MCFEHPRLYDDNLRSDRRLFCAVYSVRMRIFSYSIDRAGILRTLRYVLVGSSTLCFDLVLLYVLVSVLGVPLYIATPASFLVAASTNYLISRKFVFSRTERTLARGYAYFLTLVVLGALATTLLVLLLTQGLLLPYLVARILSAGLVGIGNYFANLLFTFRVAGKH